jgi:hypothetical protein
MSIHLIETRLYLKRKLNLNESPEKSVEASDDIVNTKAYIRTKVVNTESDKNDILNAMVFTREHRFKWIKQASPTLTDILNEYPKYIQLPYLVSIHVC